jgi:hypothetical protein
VRTGRSAERSLQKTDHIVRLGHGGSRNPPVQGWDGNAEVTGDIANKNGSGHSSLALGYTIMVASFLLIYFGICSYRDNTLDGQISFDRAFASGILITLITTVCSPHGRSSTSTSCPIS